MSKVMWKELDRIIKETWKPRIERDYDNGLILNEDTLKNAVYYHLRTALEQHDLLKNLRIFTECTYFGFNQIHHKCHMRPDMIIVNGEKVIAIFEFKYKSAKCYDLEGEIYRDYAKMNIYHRKNNCLDGKCQFYVAAITPTDFDCPAWLTKRQTNNWAKGRVTELNAYAPNGEMKFDIISYNGWNPELNTVAI